MKPILVLLVLAASLGGCGGSASTSPSAGASGASGASGRSGAQSVTGSTASPNDESQIADTAKTWLTQGGCDLMTDRFLEDQTQAKNPSVACKTFETVFQPPVASPDQITVTAIKVDGTSASATIGDTLGTGVTSTFTFKKVGGSWRIDRASN